MFAASLTAAFTRIFSARLRRSRFLPAFVSRIWAVRPLLLRTAVSVPRIVRPELAVSLKRDSSSERSCTRSPPRFSTGPMLASRIAIDAFGGAVSGGVPVCGVPFAVT